LVARSVCLILVVLFNPEWIEAIFIQKPSDLLGLATMIHERDKRHRNQDRRSLLKVLHVLVMTAHAKLRSITASYL
jgi:hypothetical protein